MFIVLVLPCKDEWLMVLQVFNQKMMDREFVTFGHGRKRCTGELQGAPVLHSEGCVKILVCISIGRQEDPRALAGQTRTGDPTGDFVGRFLVVTEACQIANLGASGFLCDALLGLSMCFLWVSPKKRLFGGRVTMLCQF